MFKLIALKMAVMISIIVNWLVPGTIADNLLFAFLLLNLGLKTNKIVRTTFANMSARLTWEICSNNLSSLILF